MKIDKDDLWGCGLIGGLAICSPLVGVYYGAKWIYNHTPQKIKKKREQDLKIHELEEKLGLIGRDNKVLYYDPHYSRNRNENRNDYLVDLKGKIDCNYNSSDIITIVEESLFGSSILDEDSDIFDEDSEYRTLIMVHKDYYNIPKGIIWKADLYPGFNVLGNTFTKLSTLSECGKYSDYYVIPVPGKFQRKEIICGTGKFVKFINDFKKINKKN